MTSGPIPTVVGVGLSVGATTLVAVMTGREPVLRTPILTVYPDRPAEVGDASENPNLGEPGLPISGFVDRVGDPAGIVAKDGSVHRAETILADSLQALSLTLTGGHHLVVPVAVTHPAHWPQGAIEALRVALATEWELCTRPRPVLL